MYIYYLSVLRENQRHELPTSSGIATEQLVGRLSPHLEEMSRLLAVIYVKETIRALCRLREKLWLVLLAPTDRVTAERGKKEAKGRVELNVIESSENGWYMYYFRYVVDTLTMTEYWLSPLELFLRLSGRKAFENFAN